MTRKRAFQSRLIVESKLNCARIEMDIRGRDVDYDDVFDFKSVAHAE